MPSKEVMHLAAKVFDLWKKDGSIPRFSPAAAMSQVRDESVDIHDIRKLLNDVCEFGGNVRPAPIGGSRVPNAFDPK